jgi:signal transduction histidine kinase
VWETLRTLIGKVSLTFVILGVAVMLATAAGQLKIGNFVYTVSDPNVRIFLCAISTILILAGVWSERSERTSAALQKIATDVAEFRAEWKSSTTPIDIDSLNNTVQKISGQLDIAVKSIVSEVRKQNRSFARSIEEKFQEQSIESAKMLETALKNELKGLNYKERDQLSSRFGDLVFHALTQMGQYQRANIETKSNEALASVESEIATAVKDIQAEVTHLKAAVGSLPAPAASPLF